MDVRAAVPPRRARRLLDRCRAGDAAAWEQVLDDYERLVFSIPLRYGLSREEAADISQGVFIALLQQLDDVQDEDSLGAWLATVTRRHTWRAMRRGRAELPLEEVPEPPSADPVEHVDDVEWLHTGLRALDPRCRELLTALYLGDGDASYAEVSRVLGRPIGSIGPSRARCLAKLRRELEGG